MIEMINTAYEFLDRMQISPVGIVIAMIVLALAFLFAVREAAAWFFKIDDIKSDVHRLQDMTAQLESEIRTLQSMIAQANGIQLDLAPKTQVSTATISQMTTQQAPAVTAPESPASIAQPSAAVASEQQTTKASGTFPIHH